MLNIRQFLAEQNIAAQEQLFYFPHFAGGARGVMVIVVGNGHGDTSSNPGLNAFHIGKGMNQIILPPAMGK